MVSDVRFTGHDFLEVVLYFEAPKTNYKENIRTVYHDDPT